MPGTAGAFGSGHNAVGQVTPGIAPAYTNNALISLGFPATAPGNAGKLRFAASANRSLREFSLANSTFQIPQIRKAQNVG
jgi:hypothetical protein